MSGAPSDLVRPAPTDVQATLSTKGYVFPVYGPASFGDSFGAPRPDLVSGWHHGEDIFAPLGTPLLAVADGVVHTVGWNEIGGWRLWLRDGDGNQFYYAHLSAFSPLAVEGKQVHAGDVLGFMGKTGDADGGLPHLHFEIHPVALLSLGYDGVIAPYPVPRGVEARAGRAFHRGPGLRQRCERAAAGGRPRTGCGSAAGVRRLADEWARTGRAGAGPERQRRRPGPIQRRLGL